MKWEAHHTVAVVTAFVAGAVTMAFVGWPHIGKFRNQSPQNPANPNPPPRLGV